jgi:hypothetical protein
MDNPQDNNATSRPKVLWGTRAIAEVINRTERQTSHLLQRGAIKSARKVEGRYCAGEPALRAEFGITS